MKKQIKLTEGEIKKLVYESVKKAMNLKEEFGDPAGFDSNSLDYGGMERDGSIESVCKGKFSNVEELKSFMAELGTVLGLEDEMDSINERIDFMIDEEGKITGW